MTAAPLPGSAACPWLTADLPGLGGRLGDAPEDFVVDEVPAYAPSGEGPHFFVRVRKRDRNTAEVREALARAAGCPPMDVGFAGRKDRHAVTTQWFSLPKAPVDPGLEGVELLETTPHNNKLRIGHLKGNRFKVRLVELDPDAPARQPALLERLSQGVPNYYGEQRFGRDTRGLRDALGFVAEPRRRVKDPQFLASVLQSAIFNTWLGARISAGALHTLVPGDVLKKRETGGLFVSEDAAADAPRVASGEVDPTGPLPGGRMRAGLAEALEREQVALLSVLPDAEMRAVLDRFAPGTRREARIFPADLNVTLDAATREATLEFFLPAGSFATVLLAELCHRAPREGGFVPEGE